MLTRKEVEALANESDFNMRSATIKALARDWLAMEAKLTEAQRCLDNISETCGLRQAEAGGVPLTNGVHHVVTDLRRQLTRAESIIENLLPLSKMVSESCAHCDRTIYQIPTPAAALAKNGGK